MVHLKTREEIEIMKTGGAILVKSVNELLPKIKPGMSTKEVDALAEQLIKANGGEISFKTVPGFNWTTCLPVNEQVVHTQPSDRILQEGDVLTVDIGVLYKGFHTDYATTIVVGKSKDAAVTRFLDAGSAALENAISVAGSASYIGEISRSIENDIYGSGYFILHELTGHGIGKELHEAPYVPGILDRPVEKTYKIEDGLVIAIEVIYSIGTERIAHEKDDKWSIVTADGSLSACFEKTVAFFDKKMFILT
ncbi:MAG: type I methionyl aminopeptidase [Patescibacteria group bacterium]|nr:type I methionyl aminopeptidase [Patescibacteria group bacterium]